MISGNTHQLYELKNSVYTVNESEVSKQTYPVSDVSSLPATLNNTDSVGFSSMRDTTDYAKARMTIIQLNCNDMLRPLLSDDDMNGVLSNGTDLSSL
ncbi:MAG: hypothetical protein ACC608_06795 [Anaerofustis sp.]